MSVILILIGLSWALWLFSRTFNRSQSKATYLILVLGSLGASYALYHHLGANQEIQKLANKHQELNQYKLDELANLVGDKKVTVNELLAELRLRLEASPDQAKDWMKLGELLLLSAKSDSDLQGAKSMEQLAQQAFDRSSQLGNLEAQVINRIEVAKLYLTYKDFESALAQLNLVLLKNSEHEGALMMKGLTESRLNRHQDAIDTWSYLLAKRQSSSESANLIQALIEKEQQKLELARTQFVEIQIDNFSNLDLHSFTKAFALVRPVSGGAPIAVKSIEVHKLKPSLRITPADLMLEGTDFWQAIDLKVEIRLSKSGFAKSEAGDIYGQVSPLKGLKPMQKIHISIDKVVN